MSIQFPANPPLNDTFDYDGKTYLWDGEKWTASTISSFEEAYVNVSGDTMTGDLTVPSLNGGPLAGMRNAIINGGFSVWQRGRTTYTTPNGYTADRWIVSGGASIAPSTTAPRRGQDAANLTTSGNGFIEQPIELNAIGFEGPFFNGTTWTLSIDATAIPTNTYIRFRNEGGQVTDEVAVAAITAASWTDLNQPAANGYGRYSVSFTVGVNANANNTCLSVIMQVPTGGMGLSNVQLEPGSQPTPFEHRPIGTELALCQRYFIANFQGSPVPRVASGALSKQVSGRFTLPQVMRATPSALNVQAEEPGITSVSAAGVTPQVVNLAGSLSGASAISRVSADFDAEL